MNPFDVIRSVRLSEAATIALEKHNTYVFEVEPKATKDDIRAAIMAVFGKKTLSVSTARYDGKVRRQNRKDAGRQPHWKKAFVRMPAGETLDYSA